MEAPGRSAGADISLGDALLAAHDLAPGDVGTLRAILDCLGFRQAVSSALATAKARIGPWHDHQPPRAERPAVPPPPRAEEPSRPSLDDPDRVPRLSGQTALVGAPQRVSFGMPDWARDVADSFLASAGNADSLPPPPLFPPSHARAILGAALASWQAGDRLDVERTVALLARGQRPARLPMLAEASLRRGVQVLLDQSPTMAPYQHDVHALLADLGRLFPGNGACVLRFRHCPDRGVRSGGASRRPWRPPAAGVPVLVVSDFGMASPSDDEDYSDTTEWLDFARRLVAGGHAAIALTPHGPSRWPAALTRVLTFVHWSERTTARQAARALRESRRAFGSWQ